MNHTVPYNATKGYAHYENALFAHSSAHIPCRGVHGNEKSQNRFSEGGLWHKKHSRVALYRLFALKSWPQRSGKWTPLPTRDSRDGATNARSAWRFTVDKDLAHRRLEVAHLTTLISHRTVRFSPHPGSGIARGAQANAPDRRCQNTFALPLAALLMAHSMCDMPHLRPGLLARSVMHRAQPCRRLAHHIDCKPPLNEARELASRLSPQ